MIVDRFRHIEPEENPKTVTDLHKFVSREKNYKLSLKTKAIF